MKARELPALLDCKAVQLELGVSRTVAEKIMRALPKQRVPGVQKNYVRRDRLRAYLDEHEIAA